MSFKMKDHKVRPYGRMDAIATVLGCTHARVLIFMASITVGLWAVYNSLYLNCEVQTLSGMDRHLESTHFYNDEPPALEFSEIHSIKCQNTTNNYWTTLPYTSTDPDVLVEWFDMNEYRCLQEDAKHGRTTYFSAMYLFWALLAANALCQGYLLMRTTRKLTNHAAGSAAVLAIYTIVVGILEFGLYNTIDYMYYTNDDSDKRDIVNGRWWIWLILIIGAIGAFTFAIVYGVYAFQTGMLFFGVISDSQIEMSKGYMSFFGLPAGDLTVTVSTDSKGFKHRYVRTDTLLAQHRHESLMYAAVFAVITILAATAVNIHDEKPGTFNYELIKGAGLVGVYPDGVSSEVGLDPLFVSNCTPYAPFVMNVSNYNHVVSTKHHIRHHIKHERNAAAAMMGIFFFLLVAEGLGSVFVWLKQTSRFLSQSVDNDGNYVPMTQKELEKRDRELPIMDLMFSIIPLIGQLVSTYGVTATSLCVGYAITWDDDNGLKVWLLAAAILCTLSTLIQMFHTSVYVAHALMVPQLPESQSNSKSA